MLDLCCCVFVKIHCQHTLSPSQSATAPLLLKWFQLMSNLSRLSLEAEVYDKRNNTFGMKPCASLLIF